MKRLLISALIVDALCLPAQAQKKSGDDFNDLIKRYYAAWSTLKPEAQTTLSPILQFVAWLWWDVRYAGENFIHSLPVHSAGARLDAFASAPR